DEDDEAGRAHLSTLTVGGSPRRMARAASAPMVAPAATTSAPHSPTLHPDGPIWPRRSEPSPPPDASAAPPSSTPAIGPPSAAAPRSPAQLAAGRCRASSTPAAIAATSGIPSRTDPGPETAPVGSAARIGTLGTGPTATRPGLTTVPTPSVKPGPSR